MGMISSLNMSFHFTLIVPMIINIVWAFVLFNYLPSKPVGMTTLEHHHENHQNMETQEETKQTMSRDSTPQNINMNVMNHEVLPFIEEDEYITMIGILKKKPKILTVALALGFLKFISYALFFNLPLLLAGSYNLTETSIISIFFDLGMMPGGKLILC